MLNKFLSKIKTNLIVIIPILMMGIFFSYLSLVNIKVGHQSKAYYKMSYVNEKFYFQYVPRLLFEVGGNNIFLIEKLHRLMRLNEIDIPKECYIGSRFDDSNEYARKRNQLGFNPGFDFKISRLDNVLTIIYNSDKKNTEFCLKEFIQSFTLYQDNIYQDFIRVFDLTERLDMKTLSLVENYGNKYDLLKYFDEFLTFDPRNLSQNSKNKIEKSGADIEMALRYLDWVEEMLLVRKNIKSYYFEKVDGALIGEINNKSLNPNKILIIIILNLISIFACVSYILIKEYDL